MSRAASYSWRAWFQPPSSVSLGGRIARGAAWSLVGAITARLLNLTAMYLVARSLGTSAFGEFGMIQGTVGFLAIFSGFGLGMATAKHVAEVRMDDPIEAGRIIAATLVVAAAIGITVTGIGFGFAPVIASEAMSAPHLTVCVRVGSVVALLSAIHGIQISALTGLEAFAIIARVNIVSAVCSVPLLVCGAWMDGVPGLVTATLLAGLLNCLIASRSLRSECRRQGILLSLTEFRRTWKDLSYFSTMAVLGALVITPVTWICQTLLAREPNGYEQLGLFSAANQWRLAILFVPAAVGSTFLPYLTQASGTSKFPSLLRAHLAVNAAVALLVALPLAAFPDWVLTGYGEDFRSGSEMLTVLAVSAVIISVNNAFSRATASQGRMGLDFIFHIAWGATCLIAAFALIPRHGGQGLAWACLLAALVQALCQWSSFAFRRRQ